MSRGVRDLRDLICVSRLTCNESEEEFLSDDNADLDKELKGLSLNDQLDSRSSSRGSSATTPVGRIVSPDSGFITNGSSSSLPGGNQTTSGTDNVAYGEDMLFFADIKGNPTPTPPRKDVITAGTAQFKSQKKKKRKRSGGLPLEPSRHDLPRITPLPPVTIIPGSPVVSEKEFGYSSSKQPHKSTVKSRVNFDDMLVYMDATIVAGWLTRCNVAVEKLCRFVNKGDNFVRFAHFWLSDFPDVQKKDIFSMEFDFLLDELGLAFAVGRENRNIVRSDLLDMCGAVFREYPATLLGAKGPHQFLDYLDTLCSERQDQYRKLLSDVKCSTTNRQYAQWLLATRSLALVNMWSSVLNFYQNLTGEGCVQGIPIHDLLSSNENVNVRRMVQAIRLGFIDVVHYMIVNGHVNPSHCDSHRRTLSFSAVMHNQPAVLKYLIGRAHPVIEINQKADTGNTALHAAANNGNSNLVEILCGCEGININDDNPQCENATPLHLAAMHGHTKVVEILLKHGADRSLRMGTTSARDLAHDFDHPDIVEMLDSRN